MRRIVITLVGVFVMSGFLSTSPADAALAPPPTVPVGESITCDGVGSHTARLYRTLFGRNADIGGLGYWVAQRRAGLTGEDVAYWMTQSIEYNIHYGAIDDAGFVHAIYQNLLGRPADPGGHAYWLDLVDNAGRHSVASWITQSDEFEQRWPFKPGSICELAGRHGLDEVRPGIVAGRTGSTVTVVGDRDLIEFSAVDGRRTYARSIPGDVVVNANWFTGRGSQAPVVSNGVRSGSGDIVERGQLIFHPYECAGRAPGFHHVWMGEIYSPEPCVTSAVSGVSLVHKGQRADAYPGITITRGYTNTSRSHSFIGFDQHHVVIIATTSMNASQLADYALSLGVVEGIMLDGGGSTQIATPNGSITSSRSVPAFAVLSSKFD